MQSAPVNSGEVELEWLEIPAFLITECQPDARRDTCILIPASPGTDVPDYPVTETPHQSKELVEGSLPVPEPSK